MSRCKRDCFLHRRADAGNGKRGRNGSSLGSLDVGQVLLREDLVKGMGVPFPFFLRRLRRFYFNSSAACSSNLRNLQTRFRASSRNADRGRAARYIRWEPLGVICKTTTHPFIPATTISLKHGTSLPLVIYPLYKEALSHFRSAPVGFCVRQVR